MVLHSWTRLTLKEIKYAWASQDILFMNYEELFSDFLGEIFNFWELLEPSFQHFSFRLHFLVICKVLKKIVIIGWTLPFYDEKYNEKYQICCLTYLFRFFLSVGFQLKRTTRVLLILGSFLR